MRGTGQPTIKEKSRNGDSKREAASKSFTHGSIPPTISPFKLNSTKCPKYVQHQYIKTSQYNL
jgi:hypothetical protein